MKRVSYIQIDERHQEQHSFVSVCHKSSSPHFGRENMAALQIIFDIQRWFAVPTESLLARLSVIHVHFARNIALTYCASFLNIFTLPLGVY